MFLVAKIALLISAVKHPISLKKLGIFDSIKISVKAEQIIIKPLIVSIDTLESLTDMTNESVKDALVFVP